MTVLNDILPQGTKARKLFNALKKNALGGSEANFTADQWESVARLRNAEMGNTIPAQQLRSLLRSSSLNRLQLEHLASQQTSSSSTPLFSPTEVVEFFGGQASASNQCTAASRACRTKNREACKVLATTCYAPYKGMTRPAQRAARNERRRSRTKKTKAAQVAAADAPRRTAVAKEAFQRVLTRVRKATRR